MAGEQETAPNETVVRIIIETPSPVHDLQTDGQPFGAADVLAGQVILTQAVNELAATVLRLTEVTERLAVVDESDAEIIQAFTTVSERLGVLEGFKAEVDQLSERLSGVDLEALAQLVLPSQLAEPATSPELSEQPTLDASVPEIEDGSDSDEAIEPSEEPAQPSPAETEDSREVPDYMIVNEAIHVKSARVAERILLLLLDQTGRRYVSPNDSTTRDLSELLGVSTTDMSNGTLSLRSANAIQAHVKNYHTIKSLEMSDLELFNDASMQRKTWFSDRLGVKIRLAQENAAAVLESLKGIEIAPDLERLLRIFGEKEENRQPAVFSSKVNDAIAELSQLLGKEVSYSMLFDLEEAGLIRSMSHHKGQLREYSLTNAGRAYIGRAQQAPPFLVPAQAL
jgi:hypothetical protein